MQSQFAVKIDYSQKKQYNILSHSQTADGKKLNFGEEVGQLSVLKPPFICKILS